MALNMGATPKMVVVAVVAMLLVVSFEKVRVEAQEEVPSAPAPAPGPQSASPGSLLSSLIYTALVAGFSFIAAKAF